MSKKLTGERFIEKAKKIHGDKFDYKLINYINCETKIKILCKKCNNIFEKTPEKHVGKSKKNRAGCPFCARNNTRLTKEEFLNRATKKYGSKFEYILDNFEKSTTKIKIKCLLHNNIFEQTPNDHISNDCGGCKFCRKELSRKLQAFTQKQFIEKAQLVHGKDKYDYSKAKYINTTTKIKIICKKHGEFEQFANHHIRGRGCKICAYENVANKNRFTQEEFIEKSKTIHGEKYNYDFIDFKNCDKKVKIKCDKHNCFFYKKPSEHMKGGMCPKCAIEYVANCRRIPQEEFIRRVRLIHKKTYNYSKSKYISCDKKIEIICNIHGSFFQTPYVHLKGAGCPYCYGKISSIEKIWLDHNNIPNDNKHRQVTLKLKNNKYICADGYTPETNTVYELYGDYFHGNPKFYKPNRINIVANKKYGELYIKTIEREKMIIESGYKLISIWEHDFKKQLNLSNGNKPTTS